MREESIFNRRKGGRVRAREGRKRKKKTEERRMWWNSGGEGKEVGETCGL